MTGCDSTALRINPKVILTDPPHSDLHMHTIYCDGHHTPEEMVQSAIEKGMTCIGFSGHSYVDFDPEAGMDRIREDAYRREIARLKDVYLDRIRIYCGIELDYETPWEGTAADCSKISSSRSQASDFAGILPGSETDEITGGRRTAAYYRENFDYVIGSVHYVRLGPVPGSGDWPGSPVYLETHTDPEVCASPEVCAWPGSCAAVDHTPEILEEAVRVYFQNDFYQAAEAYYALVADVVRRTGCDIIGHFDLISKFNEKKHYFDEEDPRYIAAWKKALDQLIPTGRVFEINTGGISRGWKSTAYPAQAMIQYIRERGGRFLLSSDSHDCCNIGYQFIKYA